MEYKILGKTGLKASRLGFGTAEIGFKYGLGKKQIPSEKKAIRLLKQCVDLGINYFDTAFFYGLAEERIGKSGIAKEEGVIITTKCGQFLEKGEDPRGKELEHRIRQQVETSLRNLKTECATVLMLHGGSEEQITRGEITDILFSLRREGKARYIGISTRGEDATFAAIDSGVFEIIQVAFSILDQRMSEYILSLAQKKRIGIVNRSVLLKGVLSDFAFKLPESLGELGLRVSSAKLIADRIGISLPELAIRYTLSEPAIGVSLIGTNKMKHLTNSLAAIKAGPLPVDVVSSLKRLAVNDPAMVDPSKWPAFN